MGEYSKALQVILIKLKNVRKAVQYVEKQNDKSLWNQLIDRTLTDAKGLMPELLDAVKGHPFVDRQELIQKIPDDLKNKIIGKFDETNQEKSNKQKQDTDNNSSKTKAKQSDQHMTRQPKTDKIGRKTNERIVGVNSKESIISSADAENVAAIDDKELRNQSNNTRKNNTNNDNRRNSSNANGSNYSDKENKNKDNDDKKTEIKKMTSRQFLKARIFVIHMWC